MWMARIKNLCVVPAPGIALVVVGVVLLEHQDWVMQSSIRLSHGGPLACQTRQSSHSALYTDLYMGIGPCPITGSRPADYPEALTSSNIIFCSCAVSAKQIPSVVAPIMSQQRIFTSNASVAWGSSASSDPA